MRYCRVFFVWMLMIVPGAISHVRAEEQGFRIAAAISMKASLEEARPLLEKAAGMSIVFNYGASGALAAQIERGAPVDLFISADTHHMTRLTEARQIAGDTVSVVVYNELVLVAPLESNLKTLEDLKGKLPPRTAIGEPRLVPAGYYAQQVLQYMGCYQTLKDSGKLVTGGNVAQVLAYAERGEVDAAFVYRSDAAASRQVRVVAAAPAGSHEAITYVMGIPLASRNAAGARVVQKTLHEAPVQQILKSRGFVSLVEAAEASAQTAPAER